MKNLIIALVSLGVMVGSGTIMLKLLDQTRDELVIEYADGSVREWRLFVQDGPEKPLPRSSSVQSTHTTTNNDFMSLPVVNTTLSSSVATGSRSEVFTEAGNSGFSPLSQSSDNNKRASSVHGGGGSAALSGMYAMHGRSAGAEGIGYSAIFYNGNLGRSLGGNADNPLLAGGAAAPGGSVVSPGDAGAAADLPTPLPVGDGFGFMLLLVGMFFLYRKLKCKYSI